MTTTVRENVVSFDRTRKIVPSRLQEARKAMAYTQTEVAAQIDLTRQAVSAFEQGAKNPDPTTLHKIAQVLGKPVAFFLSEDRRSFGPFSTRTYRSFGQPTKKRNEQCDVLSEWAADVVHRLADFVEFPDPVVPSVSLSADEYEDEDIEDAASAVRSAWGLGLGPIGNVLKLLESKGIFVLKLPVSSGKVNAFSFWNGARPFIAIGSESTTCVRRRFDLAHELGHLVLHQGIGEEELEDRNILNRVEAEANRFAGAFLLPRTSYPNEVFSTKLDAFIELKKRWKVAISAQVYRCADLCLFTDRQVLNLRKQLSFRKLRTVEPLDTQLEIEEPTVLSRAARMIFEAGALMPSQFLVDLSQDVDFASCVTGVDFSSAAKSADRDAELLLK